MQLASSRPAAGAGAGAGGEDPRGDDHTDTAIDENDNVDDASPPPTALRHSPRLKGYTTLFVSALYNYIAASEELVLALGDKLLGRLNLCTDDAATAVTFKEQSTGDDSRLRFAAACSMITLIITFAIILCHFDFCTPLRGRWFSSHGKVELCILLFLTSFWFIATWFTTTIKGPAGEGKEQFNLYFSSWVCCWVSFWTLESWCVSSGRASFERFVRSWPNRCPLWIVTFMLSLTDFLFALDAKRHWRDGTMYSPYVHNLFSGVSDGEWNLLLLVTASTFVVSLAWVLAEIFRESRTNVGSLKSGLEIYVEGLSVHVIALAWIITVIIVTMPGGSASLMGNLYFTSWGTLFSVIGTFVWWVRDWRQGILDIIHEQQMEYDKAKQMTRMREERRLAKKSKEKGSEAEEHKMREDNEAVLCEDDPVDDDITISIASGMCAHLSDTPSPETNHAASSDSNSGILTSARSVFLSFVYPLSETQGDQVPRIH